MTVDEAIETIKGNRWIACSEKYQEAINVMENTMKKYQNIENVMKDYRSNPIDCLFRIHRILER